MKKVFYCLVPGLLTVCFLLLGNVRGIAANANLAMISFTNFTPNPVAPGGHPTSIKFQVYNYGPASVGSSAHTLLDMYLSSNNIFGDGDDVNIGTYNWGQSLPALSLTTATISGSLLMSAFTIPAGASGQYHLFLKISHTATSGLTDPDPSDNWAMLATTITVGSGDTTPPTVQSITRLNPGGQLTSAASVVYRVTFSENVNNVATSDFTLVDVSGTITSESVASVKLQNQVVHGGHLLY